MRTLIIDHYQPGAPQMETLYNVIKDITIHTVETREYSSIGSGEDFKLYDIVILSGSHVKLAEPGVLDAYSIETDILRRMQKPILGICFGHQLLATAFGETVVPMGTVLEGYYPVRCVQNNELFANLGDEFLVMESHTEMITNVPYNFMKLADSKDCAVEAMKHEILPIFGVQFHPERFDDMHPAGEVILENFFRLAALYV